MFYRCVNLASVTFGNSVTNIDYSMFMLCSSLTGITVDAANSGYSSLNGVVFNKDQTTLVAYPPGRAGSYTLPNGTITIGQSAFYYCGGLMSVTLPDSLVSIGSYAFRDCHNLMDIEIPNGVTSLGTNSFHSCSSLTNVTLPDSVNHISTHAFDYCTNLESVTMGDGVAYIGDYAFYRCANLIGVYFEGDAPGLGGGNVFLNANNVTVYYLAGTTGWGAMYGDRPTALWILTDPVTLVEPGITANQFGFSINGSSGQEVVVEANISLTNSVWLPLQTNTLGEGSLYFSDSQWTNYPARFYRVRIP